MSDPSSPFDLKSTFMPGQRSSADDFWLGLGLVAVVDAVRLTLTPAAGVLSWLLVAFFVTCVFMNRLRDANRAPGLALLVLAIATVIKSVTGLFAMGAALMPHFLTFLNDMGVDPNDPAQMYSPEVQAAYQEWLRQDPSFAVEILGAGAWLSAWGFWGALLLAGLWVARMPRQHSSEAL